MWRGFAGREALRLLHMPWISEPWHAACRAQGSTAVQVLFFTFPSNGGGGLPAALGPQHWDGDGKITGLEMGEKAGESEVSAPSVSSLTIQNFLRPRGDIAVLFSFLFINSSWPEPLTLNSLR